MIRYTAIGCACLVVSVVLACAILVCGIELLGGYEDIAW